jgi:hypothetical protein
MNDLAWRKLHEERFSELPFDCGNDISPGIIYGPDLRDWSAKATTPDQYRIEKFIDRFDLRDKRVLHVGIGNSGLAKRFHRRVKEIVGTTIDDPEIKVARTFDFPNYTVVVHNKYSSDSVLPGKFDVIVDNNLTSPCCCLRHLAALFDLFADRLAEGGMIVTDRVGLWWIPEGSNPRWRFDLEDLAAVAAAADLVAHQMNANVYALSRSAPPSPTARSLSRHFGRRALAFPAKAVQGGPRRLARMAAAALRRLST